MYYKTKSKTNWPVVITVAVIIFFVVIITAILVTSYIKSKKEIEGNNKIANNAIPEVELSLNTLEPNQERVFINVKITTTDPEGLAKIVIPGLEEILIKEENQQAYETTFGANLNAIYEIQAYGKNGVYGSDRIQVSNIKAFTSTEPYIPEGFTKVGDSEVSTGLVVRDSRNNEYVWIPVPGGQLTRNRQDSDVRYYETDSEYFQFVNSVGKYQGFYLSRYEAGAVVVGGKEVATSKPNATPIQRISFNKALQLSKEVAITYKYGDYQTSIISSSAWDTVLNWLDKSHSGYSSSLQYGNYTGSLRSTGGTSTDKVNNIYDLAGNLAEWTSENYKLSEEELDNLSNAEEEFDYRVIRGGSTSNKSTPNRTNAGNPKSAYEHVGFRYVLYKD